VTVIILGSVKDSLLKQKYIRAEFIAERLVAIVKTLLLKRMDSSFYAFKETLNQELKLLKMHY
jgi:hypothetical protein